MLDYHVHTEISADCNVPMKRMAQAAREAGIREVGFAEHIDLGLPVGDDFTLDFDAYEAVFDETRREFPDLDLRRGIEAGMDPATLDEVAALIQTHPCDFVIGSLHVVFDDDPYYEAVWQKHTHREIYDEYLRVSLEMVKRCDFYDVLGHIGYIGKFCPHEDKLLRYSDFTDVIDEILKTLVHRGKALEVNTNGLYMTPSTMPETAIVNRYFELGGELVTIGSDAHYECVVGHAVPETLEKLKNIGFKYICAFDNRRPRLVKLP